MTGTIKVNIFMGCLAFLVTLFTALSGNVFSVSLERAVYAFLLFFIGMFPVRWFLHKLSASAEQAADSQNQLASDPSQKGTHVDLTTPDAESNLSDAAFAQHDLLSENEPSEQFAPLIPKRIERNPTLDPENDPANIANAIRRLTDE